MLQHRLVCQVQKIIVINVFLKVILVNIIGVESIVKGWLIPFQKYQPLYINN